MPLKGLWPTNCGVKRVCISVVHRIIDVQRRSAVTRSVPLGGMWPAGCWDRTDVDVVSAGFCWVCTVFMFSCCGLIV